MPMIVPDRFSAVYNDDGLEYTEHLDVSGFDEDQRMQIVENTMQAAAVFGSEGMNFDHSMDGDELTFHLEVEGDLETAAAVVAAELLMKMDAAGADIDPVWHLTKFMSVVDKEELQ